MEYNFYPVSSGVVNFKVRAAHDAHIALTSGPSESDDNMVEVFIGGWSNQKSVIRRNKQKPEKAEADTPNVLNGGEFRGFWIRWYEGVSFSFIYNCGDIDDGVEINLKICYSCSLIRIGQ